MKHLRKQHYILVIAAIVAVMAACSAYVFMYRAIQNAIMSGEKDKEKMLSVAAENMAAQDAAETYSETADSRAILPSLLVSSADPVPFVNAVEAVGSENGSVVTISSLADSSAGSASAITAHISISGSWPSVMRSIELVENLPYAVSESRLVLSVGGASSPSAKKAPQWTAAMDISVLSTP